MPGILINKEPDFVLCEQFEVGLDQVEPNDFHLLLRRWIKGIHQFVGTGVRYKKAIQTRTLFELQLCPGTHLCEVIKILENFGMNLDGFRVLPVEEILEALLFGLQVSGIVHFLVEVEYHGVIAIGQAEIEQSPGQYTTLVRISSQPICTR